MNRRTLLRGLGAASVASTLADAPAQRSSAGANPDREAPTRTVALLPKDQVESAPERLLDEEPTVDLAEDGTATIRWRTVVPTQGATIYLGIPNDEVELNWPIYNANQSVSEAAASLEHKADVDISRWLGRYNARAMLTGGGTFAYRLELIDPRKPAARFIDRHFQFEVKESRFRLGLTILEGPFLALLEERSVTIFWRTDQPSTGEVVLERDRVIRSPGAPTTFHQVRVDGLPPNATVRYRMRAVAGDRTTVSREFAFRTGTSQAEFSFVFTCDGRTGGLGGGETALEGINGISARMLASQMSRHRPAFLIFTGDLISGYTTREDDFRAQLRSWKRIYGPLWHGTAIYTGMGNHESLLHSFGDGTQTDKAGEASAEAVFASEFVHPANGPEPERPGLPPYRGAVYSFDFGLCHFVQLNSDYWYSSNPESRPGNPFGRLLKGQLDWFEHDLAVARAKDPTHIFVFVHEPAFPNGGHVTDALWGGGDPEGVAARDRFWTILTRAGATAVFSGHEHNYSRVRIDGTTPVHRDLSPNPAFAKPTWQITQGAAGAPFYPRDYTVPWTDAIQKFVAHTWAYCHVEVKGKQALLKTYSYTGELLDEVDLSS